MGQSSISMLNKVGYSMFWGSMWDNKIIYNRLLKEDIYIDKFFDLIFNDNLSVNIFNIKKHNKNYNSIKPSILRISNKPDFSLYRYLKYSDKIKCFNSKIWVLKYQNWVIIYNFIYIQQFEKIIKNKEKFSHEFNYKNNFSYNISLYSKINKNIRISYNLYNKNKKKVFF